MNVKCIVMRLWKICVTEVMTCLVIQSFVGAPFHDAGLDLLVLVVALLEYSCFTLVVECQLRRAFVESARQLVFHHGSAHDTAHQIVWTRTSIYPWQTFSFTVAQRSKVQDPRQTRSSSTGSTWSAVSLDTGEESRCWTFL
jgi:hypothetical protein